MAKKSDQRPLAEKIFLTFFFPAVLAFYLIYKYPTWFVGNDPQDLLKFHLFGKSPGFWYNTLYTTIIVGTCIWVLKTDKNRYQRSKKKGGLSTYQRKKFTSILLVQLIAFYFFPSVLPGLRQEGGFFNDPPKVSAKTAHVYVYPAVASVGKGIEKGSVASAGGALYMFLVIPVAVWFFGKRYCSWFCACGNLAETVGVLPWGQRWVRLYTPRGPTSKKLEIIQVVCLAFAVFFGVMLVVDGLKLFTATSTVARLGAIQDFVIDFMFGAIVGVGAYPIFGTRVWCRYGCPMAGGMRLFGKFSRSKFAVVPNDKCKGLGLCTQACPMGIDVAAYAHKEKKPIEVAFGLNDTPCIGCGGCIDVCPVDALSFAPISGKENAGLEIVSKS